MGNTIMPEVVGIDSLYTAKILSDTADAFTTGPASYFAPLAELKHDPKADATLTYYDNSAMFAYAYEGEAEEEATISGVTEQKFSEVTGKSFDPTTGIIFDNGDPLYSPYYALGYRISIGGGIYKYRWFYKGLFVPSSETMKTKGDKVDPQSLALTFKPLRTIYKWTVTDPRDVTKTIVTGLKVARADTTQASFVGADTWFSQVQVPGSIGAPSALSFTALPANSATAVVATAKPVLTFNNVLADYSGVSLVGNSAIVAATVSADSTGKVITISPTAPLTSAAIYTIVLASVSDVYGQTLATQAIKFTVA